MWKWVRRFLYFLLLLYAIQVGVVVYFLLVPVATRKIPETDVTLKAYFGTRSVYVLGNLVPGVGLLDYLMPEGVVIAERGGREIDRTWFDVYDADLEEAEVRRTREGRFIIEFPNCDPICLPKEMSDQE
jgi:hypothetical protein